MKLHLKRYGFRDDHTKSLLFVDGEFFCHVLEDKVRAKKLYGETAIPLGCYRVEQRKEWTPLTEKYRQRFDWFKYHWQLIDVPGFEFIYIHIGNTQFDTDGCLLVGDQAHEDSIGKSTQAYKRLYKLMKKESFIEIEISRI